MTMTMTAQRLIHRRRRPVRRDSYNHEPRSLRSEKLEQA